MWNVKRKVVDLLARHAGVEVRRVHLRWHDVPVSHATLHLLPEADRRIALAVEPYTCTALERVAALIRAVRYIVRSGIPGAFVECGVWRGGSMMAVALTLLEEKVTDRDLYLFDTFEGMTAPTERDLRADGAPAEVLLATTPRRENESDVWCYAAEAEVRANLSRTAYPSERIHFVRGRVEETLPHSPPLDVAMLRLDTDWYESTKHELTHLYPRIAAGGVLIIDDYGDWQGAREATDEYLRDHPEYRILLYPIDGTGRLAIKVPAAERDRRDL